VNFNSSLSCFSLSPLSPFLHSVVIGLLQIIKKLIERKQAQIRKVYPGLSCFKDGVRQIPIDSIPGIRTLPETYSAEQSAGDCLSCMILTICEFDLSLIISTGETGWKPVGKG